MCPPLVFLNGEQKEVIYNLDRVCMHGGWLRCKNLGTLSLYLPQQGGNIATHNTFYACYSTWNPSFQGFFKGGQKVSEHKYLVMLRSDLLTAVAAKCRCFDVHNKI